MEDNRRKVYPSKLSQLYDRVAPVISEWWSPQGSVFDENRQRANAFNSALVSGAKAVGGMLPSQPADVLSLPLAALTYSPDAESAVFPKTMQYPSSVVKSLREAFGDDPPMANYAARQFGKVDDPLQHALLSSGDWENYLDYVNLALEPTKTKTTILLTETPMSSHERDVFGPALSHSINTINNIHRGSLYQYNDIYEHAIDTRDTGPLQRMYKDITATIPPRETVDYIKGSWLPVERTLKEHGIEPRGLPIEERVRKYNQIQARINKKVEGTKEIGDLSPGYRFVELQSPDSFIREGQQMGHSVGGYANEPNYSLGGPEAIKTGLVRVFSIRDKNGRPTITIETMRDQQGKYSVIQAKQAGNRQNWTPEDERNLDLFFQKTGFNIQQHPRGFDDTTRYLPQSITHKYKDRLRGTYAHMFPDDPIINDWGVDPGDFDDIP